jgi:Protein of unknown function (DUF4199)
MEAKKSNPLVQFGLLSGLVSILFLIILYMGGTKFFTSPLAWCGLLIPIIFAVVACRKQKRENGGYLEFRQALKISFGVMVLSSLLYSLASYVLLNYIDTAFRESMLQATIEMTQKWMQRFNAPQDAIDKAIQELSTTNPWSLGRTIINYAWFCIVWFIIALIVSAIVKKKKPEFPQATV